ncbi:MAG: 50S ribosomal protein L11 methyltransferase [Bacilli bacterium]
MDLWRITVSTTSVASDAVGAALEAAGALAVAIEDHADVLAKIAAPSPGEWIDEEVLIRPPEGAFVHAYIEWREDQAALDAFVDSAETALRRVAGSGLQSGSLRVSVQTLIASEYLDAWRQYYHLQTVSERFVVVPVWETEKWRQDGDRIPLVIDPGVAFGTGAHQTTALCLREVERVVQSGVRVLDIGTGTGILAVAAAKLGAAEIIALDIDEHAVRAARNNALQNGVSDRLHAHVSDLLADLPAGERGFDIVTANLLADLIRRLLPKIGDYMNPGGLLMVSGIVERQVEDTSSAMRSAGFSDLCVKRLDEWAVVLGRYGA